MEGPDLRAKGVSIWGGTLKKQQERYQCESVKHKKVCTFSEFLKDKFFQQKYKRSISATKILGNLHHLSKPPKNKTAEDFPSPSLGDLPGGETTKACQGHPGFSPAGLTTWGSLVIFSFSLVKFSVSFSVKC